MNGYDLRGLKPRSPVNTCIDCPVYKAPTCFKELLSSSFQSSEARWRRFATYFNIHEPVGRDGLVEFWVEQQQNRDRNNIKRLLEFANSSNFAEDAKFCEDINILIAEHQNPDHSCCVNDPSACFVSCRKCFYTTSTTDTSRSPSPCERDSISSQSTSVFHKISDADHPKGEAIITSGSCHPSSDQKDLRNRKTTQREEEQPSNTPTPPVVDCDNILHLTDSSQSPFETTFPYNRFRHRHKWLEFVIVFFLVYQMIASTFITICEDEGPYRVFRNGNQHVDIMELVRRICLFVLRVIVRVAMPFVFYRQICRMAEGERRYLKSEPIRQNSLSPNKSTTRQQIHHTAPQEVTLWSSIVPHAVMFSVILLCLGAFLTAEDKLRGDTICIRELFQIQVPFLGMQIFQFGDCLAVFFMMMVIGILKDCYCLENHLAVENYEIMRERWVLIDTFCYVTSFIMFIFTVLMFIFGNPLTPPPSCDLDIGELQLWSFWIIALTLLQFCGSAANSILKSCCVVGHILCFLFILLLTFVLRVEKIRVPPGSTVLLLYTTLAVIVFNLLLCLSLSHYRRKGCRSKRFHLSVACLVILSVSVLATATRELTQFAYFVLQDRKHCTS